MLQRQRLRETAPIRAAAGVKPAAATVAAPIPVVAMVMAVAGPIRVAGMAVAVPVRGMVMAAVRRVVETAVAALDPVPVRGKVTAMGMAQAHPERMAGRFTSTTRT